MLIARASMNKTTMNNNNRVKARFKNRAFRLSWVETSLSKQLLAGANVNQVRVTRYLPVIRSTWCLWICRFPQNWQSRESLPQTKIFVVKWCMTFRSHHSPDNVILHWLVNQNQHPRCSLHNSLPAQLEEDKCLSLRTMPRIFWSMRGSKTPFRPTTIMSIVLFSHSATNRMM